MNMEDINIVESDNETNSTSSNSSDSMPRTRNSTSRLAKKSTGTVPAEPVAPAITRRQAAMASREKLKFLGSFNPDTSAREKRKLDKKLQARKPAGALNDNRGVHLNSGIDLCDCFESSCPGCFYPCKKCGSTKCGIECRVHRKSKYESIEYHGYNFVKKNPLDGL